MSTLMEIINKKKSEMKKRNKKIDNLSCYSSKFTLFPILSLHFLKCRNDHLFSDVFFPSL